jgi:hypothetical protein
MRRLSSVLILCVVCAGCDRQRRVEEARRAEAQANLKAIGEAMHKKAVSEAGADSPVADAGLPNRSGGPWVTVSDDDIGSASRTTDDSGKTVFVVEKNSLESLLKQVAFQYRQSISVRPRELLDRNLTLTVEGKSIKDVLSIISDKCQVNVWLPASGNPALTLPGSDAAEEGIVSFPE